MLAEGARALLVLARAQQREDFSADGAGQGVAAEGGAVRSGRQHAEYVAPGDDGRQGHDAAPKRLAETVHVGCDAFVLAGERRSRAAEPGLDLVGDHEHVVRGAQLAHPREVSGGRDDDAGLALNRLDEERDDVRVAAQALGECVGIAVLDHAGSRA